MRVDFSEFARTFYAVVLDTWSVHEEGETCVANRRRDHLTKVEQEVIAEIRQRRALPPDDPARYPVDDPVAMIRHFIETRHGNIQLRFRPIAREMGIELRTLERNFTDRYEKNLRAHHVEMRLKFATYLLQFFPETRIKEVAGELGYTEVRDFNRFFREYMHESPSEFRRRVEARPEDYPDLMAGDGARPTK
jgi:transcriptional regulator GlxA family with amidase domain